MFDRLQPKHALTGIQANVLMTQIRAEKKNYRSRQDPVFINSHRDQNRVGKRTYKEHLYQTTVLFCDPDSHRNRNRSHSYSPTPDQKSRGKRTGYCNPTGDRAESARGKRKILHERPVYENSIIAFDPFKKIDTSPNKFSKRRLDQSPNNQNRLSPGFNLFKASHV